jgi:hypothetical protein
MLAKATNRTHFPTLTGASRNVEAWSIKPGGPDATKQPDLPVGPVRSAKKKRRELSY